MKNEGRCIFPTIEDHPLITASSGTSTGQPIVTRECLLKMIEVMHTAGCEELNMVSALEGISALQKMGVRIAPEGGQWLRRREATAKVREDLGFAEIDFPDGRRRRLVVAELDRKSIRSRKRARRL